MVRKRQVSVCAPSSLVTVRVEITEHNYGQIQEFAKAFHIYEPKVLLSRSEDMPDFRKFGNMSFYDVKFKIYPNLLS